MPLDQVIGGVLFLSFSSTLVHFPFMKLDKFTITHFSAHK